MEQSAVAYRVRDKLIVGSIVRTAMGVGLEVDPISLEMTSPEGVVSAAIGQALSRSGHVVPHPAKDQWKGMFKPFERAAGVRSYKSFMADANSVSLTMRNGKLELTPTAISGVQRDLSRSQATLLFYLPVTLPA